MFDNLKELDDVRGDDGGDWALNAAAGTLRMAAEALRRSLALRLSGDEIFGILAEALGSRACGAWRRPLIECLSGDPPPVRAPARIVLPPAATCRRPSIFRVPPTRRSTSSKRTGSGCVCLVDADPETAPRSDRQVCPGARRGCCDGLEIDTNALLVQVRRELLDGPPRAARAPWSDQRKFVTIYRFFHRAASAAGLLCLHGAGNDSRRRPRSTRRSGFSSSAFGVDGERDEISPSTPRTADLLANGAARNTSTRAMRRPATRPSARCSRTGACRMSGRGGLGRPRRLAARDYADAASADLRLADAALWRPPPTRCARPRGCAPSAASAGRGRSRSGAGRRPWRRGELRIEGEPKASGRGWSFRWIHCDEGDQNSGADLPDPAGPRFPNLPPLHSSRARRRSPGSRPQVPPATTARPPRPCPPARALKNRRTAACVPLGASSRARARTELHARRRRQRLAHMPRERDRHRAARCGATRKATRAERAQPNPEALLALGLLR